MAKITFSLDDGQEESLKKLTSILDKATDLKKNLGNIGENKLLLITAIKLVDEHFDFKQRIGAQKDKLDTLANKFKELKSLAMKYKGIKTEIKDLNNKIEIIKKDIQETNTTYENMLDKTTKSLEKIIKNAENSTKIQ